MHLDFTTLLTLQVLSSLTSAIVLASAMGPTEPAGLRDAMRSLLCLAGANGFLLLRDVEPQALSILGGNPLYWLSSAFMCRALGAFNGRARPARWPFALVFAAMLVFGAVVGFAGPYGVRAILSSWSVLVMLCGALYELARDRGLTREPTRKITFTLLAVAATGLLVRGLILLPRWAEPRRPPVTDLQIALAHLPGLLVASGFGLGFLVMHHQRVAAHAAQAAATDALTGCANRRALEAQVRVELAHAARKGRACALVVGDLDHFKTVNDRYGHAAGDAVLVEVARVFRATVRPGDMVARYGGEEFCVLLREAGPEEATVAAERLCQALRGITVHASGASITVRGSFGVAASQKGDPATWESLFRRADTALYRAKAQGRDQVVLDAAQG